MKWDNSKNDDVGGIIIIEDEKDAELVNGIKKSKDEIENEREELRNARTEFTQG